MKYRRDIPKIHARGRLDSIIYYDVHTCNMYIVIKLFNIYLAYYGARARAGGTYLVAVLHAASVIRCWGRAAGAASVIVCW